MNVFTVWNYAVLGGSFLAWLVAQRHRDEFGLGLAWGALAALLVFQLLAAVGQVIGAPIG